MAEWQTDKACQIGYERLPEPYKTALIKTIGTLIRFGQIHPGPPSTTSTVAARRLLDAALAAYAQLQGAGMKTIVSKELMAAAALFEETHTNAKKPRTNTSSFINGVRIDD